MRTRNMSVSRREARTVSARVLWAFHGEACPVAVLALGVPVFSIVVEHAGTALSHVHRPEGRRERVVANRNGLLLVPANVGVKGRFNDVRYADVTFLHVERDLRILAAPHATDHACENLGNSPSLSA